MNYTIDDSQWNTPFLSLSPGWNMLQSKGDNEYINSTQVATMTPLLSNFWNDSVSWTTSAGSSNMLTFQGSSIWVYGIGGPDQGTFVVTLDNNTLGTYNSYASAVDYHRLLFSAHDLSPSKVHNLTIINVVEGKSLAFDVAIVSYPKPTVVESARPAPSSSSAAPSAKVSTPVVSSPYTPQQLQSLLTPFEFHWNPAAYFVVVFSALLVITAVVLVLSTFITSRLAERRKRRAALSITNSESYLIRSKSVKGFSRPRPGTRLLDALRGRNISTPRVEVENVDFSIVDPKGSTHESSEGKSREGPTLW